MHYIFNDPANYSQIDELEDRYQAPASVGMPLGVTIVAGLIGFTAGGPIAGLGAICIFGSDLLHRIGTRGRTVVFNRRNPGCIAHLIDNERDMMRWLKHHGDQEVLRQLAIAYEDGQPLTRTAKKTVAMLLGEDQSLPTGLFKDRESPMLQSGKPGQPDQTAPVGKQTRLGAIDVPSTPVRPDRELPQSAAGETLINTFINCPSQCRAILAGQRSGKTLSAAVATRILAAEGTWVGYINLQDHGQGNAEAFSHAHRVIGNLAALGSDRRARQLIEDATRLIGEFYAQDDAILVIDEWMSLGAKTLQVDGMEALWREIANKATALTSNGIGSGKAIWGIAPFFKAESLRDDAKCLKLFAPLLIAIAPEQSFPWTNPKNGKQTHITYNQQVVNHASVNWSSSIKDPTPEQAREWKLKGCDRVYWWNGHWQPVGSLPEIPQAEPPVHDEVASQPAKLQAPSNNWEMYQVRDQPQGGTTTYPISEVAALRGIDRPEIEPDEPVSRPELLDQYPLLGVIWDYLERNPDRDLKQIAAAMNKPGKVSEQSLIEALGPIKSHKDGILAVLDFGVRIKVVDRSGETYRAIGN